MGLSNEALFLVVRKAFLERIRIGQITVQLPDGRVLVYGDPTSNMKASIVVHKWSMFWRLITKETIGFAESYMDGEWETDDMATLVGIMISQVKAGIDMGMPGKKFMMKLHVFRNTQKKSLENVQAHYDLGNEFYEQMLDPETMSYTCALWRDPKKLAFRQFPPTSQLPMDEFTLGQAQLNKIHYVIAKAGIKKGDTVLELGCGWGGFSIEAASKTGCSVVAYNLSIEQIMYARQKAAEVGVGHLVKFIHQDYREACGEYDAVVSIGMLEHVGHDDFPTFFELCHKNLKPGGTLVAHTITSPDAEYEVSRHVYGFIQKYIFPGAVIPSVEVLVKAMATTKFELQHMENIGLHYALTLRQWRLNFYKNLDRVFQLGYSVPFARMWDLYLTNCEAEFAVGHFGLAQMIMRRPSTEDCGPAPGLYPLRSLCTMETSALISHKQEVVLVQSQVQNKPLPVRWVTCPPKFSLLGSIVHILMPSSIYQFAKGLLFRSTPVTSESAATNGRLQMYKATASNTFRVQQITSKLTSQGRLSLSNFNKVLTVDVDNLWADVQGCTTFEAFVREAAKHKVIPLVVPQLKSITVGGAIVGIGVESGSFKHGLVHDGLLEAEVLLANGDVVVCNKDSNADLFAALPNSLGSLGYLLRVRMAVQPMRPFVKLTKTWHSTPELLVSALEEACKSISADFVDAVAYGTSGGVVVIGQMVDKVDAGRSVSNYKVENRFYESLIKTKETDFLTTVDYLWRWDTDWFWLTQIFPFLRTGPVRKLLGEKYLRSDMYKAFNDTVIRMCGQPKNQELVIQDFEIPSGSTAEWIKVHFQKVPKGKVGLKTPDGSVQRPMWLCPVKGKSALLFPLKDKLYINCGFWDAVTVATKVGTAQGNATVNKALEGECRRLGGLKTCYSSVHLSEEEFWETYGGRKAYAAVKARYDPENRIATLYEKCTH